MADISNPWAFDPVGPTSNSNVAGANIAELCAPSGINNAIRALAGMLAQATSYQSAALSSSVFVPTLPELGLAFTRPFLGLAPSTASALSPASRPMPQSYACCSSRHRRRCRMARRSS